MRALPDGGVTLTAAEAYVVSQMLLNCGEDDYQHLRCSDVAVEGLKLAQEFSEHQRLAADIRATVKSEAADDMTDLELIGKVREVLANDKPKPAAPWPITLPGNWPPIQNIEARLPGHHGLQYAHV